MVTLTMLMMLIGAMGLGVAAVGVLGMCGLFGKAPKPLELDEPVPFKLAGADAGPYREAIPRCDKCGAPTLERPRLPPAPPPRVEEMQARIAEATASVEAYRAAAGRWPVRPVEMPRHADFAPGRIVIDCNGVSIEGLGKAGDEVDRALCWQLAKVAEAVGLKFHAVPVVVVRR